MRGIFSLLSLSLVSSSNAETGRGGVEVGHKGNAGWRLLMGSRERECAECSDRNGVGLRVVVSRDLR
jgi:hypothetical protein